MGEIYNEINELSYSSILNNRNNFRKAGGVSSDEFNVLDFPGHKFFKIFFYFWNGSINSDNNIESGGLLAPTWTLNDTDKDFWRFNSAWAYLKNNAEEERAGKLEKFIDLLSNINASSPWYFKSISGLDSALERQQTTDSGFKIDDQRKQISIACLPDAFDDRIGTLLDLYRDIVWSWSMKREVLPANLRKFDMGIYIYESPIKGLHDHITKYGTHNYASLKEKIATDYQTSSKYIEFHNCEFDYNSSKSGYGNINNQEGFTPEYTINILFDDCYECRYNEIMMKNIGDIIAWDTVQCTFLDSGNSTLNYSIDKDIPDHSLAKTLLTPINTQKSEDFSNRINNGSINLEYEKYINDIEHANGLKAPQKLSQTNKYKPKATNGFLYNTLYQGISSIPGIDYLPNQLQKAFLGNLHGYSLSKFGSQLHDLAQGNILGTVQDVQEYKKLAEETDIVSNKNIHNFKDAINTITEDESFLKLQKKPKNKVSSIGNIKDNQFIADNLKVKMSKIGNINKGKSIANNL